MSLDEATRRLVDQAVAAAPALTSDQVTELRRILRPGDPTSVLGLRSVVRTPSNRTRQAA